MVNEHIFIKSPQRMSLLQQRLIGEYEKQMKQKCCQRHRLDKEKFDEIHENSQAVAVTEFMSDFDSNMFTTRAFKEALMIKYHELKKENEEKPSVGSIAGGVMAGSAAGVGVATGGAVGTVAVSGALALSAVVSTGGLVLVGVAAVGIGVGVGFGIQKLVSIIESKKTKVENKQEDKTKCEKSTESKMSSNLGLR